MKVLAAAQMLGARLINGAMPYREVEIERVEKVHISPLTIVEPARGAKVSTPRIDDLRCSFVFRSMGCARMAGHGSGHVFEESFLDSPNEPDRIDPCGCRFDGVTGLQVSRCVEHAVKNLDRSLDVLGETAIALKERHGRLLAAAKVALEIVSGTASDAPDCVCEWCALRRVVRECEEPLP